MVEPRHRMSGKWPGDGFADWKRQAIGLEGK